MRADVVRQCNAESKAGDDDNDHEKMRNIYKRQVRTGMDERVRGCKKEG